MNRITMRIGTYLMGCSVLCSIRADDANAAAPDARWDHPNAVNPNRLRSLRALRTTLDVYRIDVLSIVVAPDPNEHAAIRRTEYRSTKQHKKNGGIIKCESH